MNWCIEDHPAGGLEITHLVRPRFTERWTTGEFPIDQVVDGAFFWVDEGSGPEDAIHLYGFEWRDLAPDAGTVCDLMNKAVLQIDQFVMGQAD